MKKLLSALLICVMLLLCFAGCSGSESTEEHDHPHETTADTSVPTDSSTPEPENTVNEEELQNKSAELSRGTFEGDVYKNSLLNLSFTLPNGWVYYSDSELCSISGLPEGAYNDFAGTAKVNPAIYDMYAIHKESGASVFLCYENLLYTTGGTLTAREYLDFVESAVAGAGVSDIEDKGTVEFCSNTYENATITSGDDVKTRHTYYLKAHENFMVTLIITSTSPEAEADILACFS